MSKCYKCGDQWTNENRVETPLLCPKCELEGWKRAEGERICLRAERWDGHKTIGGSGPIHEYVSLENLLRSVAPNAELSE